jgi:hypothetical protein
LAEWSAISGSRAFKVDAFAKVNWELSDLRNDFSEADDLAAKEPAKLKEMQALFDGEAKRNNVYPLDDRFAERAVVADRPSVNAGRTKFVYYPGTVVDLYLNRRLRFQVIHYLNTAIYCT